MKAEEETKEEEEAQTPGWDPFQISCFAPQPRKASRPKRPLPPISGLGEFLRASTGSFR